MKSMGLFDRALPLYIRSLEGRKRELGEHHPDTLKSVNNLASLYARMGAHSKAFSLVEQAFDLSKQVSGAEHPNTLSILNHLGFLHKSRGDYKKSPYPYTCM